jgi:hypothetical protein
LNFDAVESYLQILAKPEEDSSIYHDREETWAAILDKGYVGAGRLIRAIIPPKKLPGHALSPANIDSTRRIAHDRVIVENTFGRMKRLFAATGHKFTLKLDLYDRIWDFCAAVTNFDISLHPLRIDDQEYYARVRRSLRAIRRTESAARSQHAATQQAYRARHR